MSANRETSEEARQTAERTGTTSGGIQYAKAPSMFWFIIPMGLLLVYGFMNR